MLHRKRKNTSPIKAWRCPFSVTFRGELASIIFKCSNTFIQCAMERLPDKDKEWGLEHDPFSDPEEKKVLFAALDSFRYVVHTS